VHYYKLGAGRGSADCHHWLGGSYNHGLDGLEKDDVKAFEHYKKSYELLMLAETSMQREYFSNILYYPLCLLWGVGCAKNPSGAWDTLQAAAARGSRPAKQLFETGKIDVMVECMGDFAGQEKLSPDEFLELFQNKKAN
jgi:TPR repeat protein